MVYAPQILTSSIIWLVVLILILPFCIFLGTEYVLTKKITPSVALFIFGLSTLLFALLLWQLLSSKVELKDQSLNISSLLYSKSIKYSDISSVSKVYEDRLPTSYILKKRTNGIGLTNYWAGHFQLRNGSTAFVLMSSPPYLVIRTNDKIMNIVSIDKEFAIALSKNDFGAYSGEWDR